MYEFDGSVTSEPLHMFVKEIHGWDTELPLTFNIYGSSKRLKTTLANHVLQHCPEISIEQITISICYDLNFEIMGLLEGSNCQCVNRCGAKLKIDDDVVLETELNLWLLFLRSTTAAVDVDWISYDQPSMGE